jgi:hypothetical protein
MAWYVQASEPVRSREPLRLPGWFAFVLDPSQVLPFAPLDQWWVQASEPVRRHSWWHVYSLAPEPFFVYASILIGRKFTNSAGIVRTNVAHVGRF